MEKLACYEPMPQIPKLTGVHIVEKELFRMCMFMTFATLVYS
jgi:hypothetical protein